MPQPPTSASSAVDMAAKVPPPSTVAIDGLQGVAALDEQTERKLDAIEMIGEEEAAGFHGPGQSEVSPGMRYLHCSRTIHQLVTDRNRAVGLYLAVASLLWTASTALLNARAENLPPLIIPITAIQRWCLPVTFGTLAALALFVSFLLIRTRIGLIYEVAKMNVLLGLPAGRVKRIGVLSIFFIMHALVSVAGAASAALFAMHMAVYGHASHRLAMLIAVAVGVGVCGFLQALYILTVLYTTSDKRLGGA